MGYNPQEIPREHNKYHGYTVRSTPVLVPWTYPQAHPPKKTELSTSAIEVLWLAHWSTEAIQQRSCTSHLRKTPTYPMNIPQTRITGNPFIFVFWGTWGMLWYVCWNFLRLKLLIVSKFQSWLIGDVSLASCKGHLRLWRFGPEKALQISQGALSQMQPAAH